MVPALDGAFVKSEPQQIQSSTGSSAAGTQRLPEIARSTRIEQLETEDEMNMSHSRVRAVDTPSLSVSANPVPIKANSLIFLSTWPIALQMQYMQLQVAGRLPPYFHNLTSEHQQWIINFWLDPELAPILAYEKVEHATIAINFH